MSVVLICIDCLRNDFINKDYADTPFLDQLVEDSLYFSNLYSTTTTTTPAVASFMTGEYSEINGVNSLTNAELSKDVEPLAEKFAASNYNTYAETTGPLVKETGLDRGFNHYKNRSHEKELFTEWEKELEEKIKEFEQPYFFYLHLWELHKPIKVPKRFQKDKFGDSKYAKALSALDRKLEHIINLLPEETTVIIHGDHGESIKWRENLIQQNLKKLRTLLRYKIGFNTRPLEQFINRLMDESDFKDHYMEAGHGENIFDFTTNVPLIINSNDIEPEEITSQVRQIDIYPTILDLENIEHQTVTGKTLLTENLEDRKAYIRACGSSLKTEKNWIRGIRYKNQKFLEYPERNWNAELYNLNKDPKELENIKDQEKKEEFRNKMPSQKMKEAKEMKIKDKLEELGYK